MRIFTSLFILLILASCTNPPYRGCDVLGAEDFVLDSYKISEGKFSILEMEGKAIGQLDPEELQEFEEVIGEGDLINIALYNPHKRELSRALSEIGSSIGFRVQDGKLRIPDVEPLSVVGLNLVDAGKTLQNAYLEKLQDVEIFLSFREQPNKQVELAGEVGIPGLTANGTLRLFDVLSKARVQPNSNLFMSYLVRNNSLLPVDMYKLMHEGDMSQNVVMRPRDKIFIANAQASSAMVMGEVSRPGVVKLTSGSMPLREILAEVGGIQFTGDKGYIQVFRGNLLKPKIYNLNWKHIIQLPSNSLLMMPGDIVYVAATPLTEWNRFISQLLPCFSAWDLFCSGYGRWVGLP